VADVTDPRNVPIPVTRPGIEPRSATRRCAIYTRTSSDEGLAQDFNSLQAQWEACAAYISSQAGEGWQVRPMRYDDAGFSGGSLTRPALCALLADVDAGLIDTIVVYKIDRLTRSLADFAKIVERLDARQASFVSVTQAFSTTSSMGRLTLNVLLSFAQFERELGAERVRDKYAASRRRGMWMGGVPPLGYDVSDRRLIINPSEAADVRWIFERYLSLKSLPRLNAAVTARGLTTKAYRARSGRLLGGHAQWHLSLLQAMLVNRIYVGEVVFQGAVWPGQHEAIVDRSVFDRVQALLAANRPAARGRATHKGTAWLTGLVFDDAGFRMTPQRTSKRNGARTYAYYVSQSLLQRGEAPASRTRISVALLDHLARRIVEAFWANLRVSQSAALLQTSAHARPEPRENGSPTASHPDRTRAIVERVEVAATTIQCDVTCPGHLDEGQMARELARIDLAATLQRVSERTWRVLLPTPTRHDQASLEDAAPGRAARHGPGFDPRLVRALVHAVGWRAALEEGGTSELQAAIARSPYYAGTAHRLLRLAFLSPALQAAILQGRQPRALNVRRILRQTLPVSWAGQAHVLGTSSPSSGALPAARGPNLHTLEVSP